MSSDTIYQANQIRFAKEAELKGMTLIGDADPSAYGSATKPGSRLYKFNDCGHLQNMSTTTVGSSSVKVCKQCIHESIVNQADSAGLDYVEYIGNRTHKFRYRSCGHDYSCKSSKVIKFPACKECARLGYHAVAKENNLVLIDLTATKPGCFTYKHNDCGHISEFYHSRIVDKQFTCRTCLEETYKQEAIENGLCLIEDMTPSKKGVRWYKFPCGHNNEMLIYNVRNGDRICKTCNPTHALKPTKLYFLRFTNKETGFEFLKFGIAVNVNSRFWGVAKRGYAIDEILIHEFETFSDAAKFERPLHKLLSKERINKNLVEHAMGTGHTECYPIEMFTIIMELLKPLNSING